MGSARGGWGGFALPSPAWAAPSKAGASGERWQRLFTLLPVLLACGLPSRASAELGGSPALPLCAGAELLRWARPGRNGPDLAETGLRSSLRPRCPSSASGLCGSLSQAQVLPVSCQGSAGSRTEHADILLGWGGGRGWFRGGRWLGPPCVLAGMGQPNALGSCRPRGAALQTVEPCPGLCPRCAPPLPSKRKS